MKNRLAQASLTASLVLALAAVAPVPASAATVNCSTSSCLTSALANAQPGDTIVLAAGTTFNGKFVAAAEGTSSAKITLRSASSSNPATLNGTGTGSGYGLHITGDHWVIQDLKVTNSQKGIMLDHANWTLIDNVEVYHIGHEAVHYRDGSSNNVIRNSYIHDTGKAEAGFGEGIYVGSDKGKWSTYIKETDNNRISGVTIGPNVTAEHVDIKEGSTGTIVENSTFNGTGISGANYADSFIDVKGNQAIIRGNTGYRNNNGIIVDAFQMHVQVDGWGQNASFTNNRLYLDNASPYVVNAAGDSSATASGNTRSPSGNMYKGNVTVSGGEPSEDTQAPTVPGGLSATAVSSSRIDLNWLPSSDNVEVSGYDVYRNGSFLKTVSAPSASDTGLSASTTYSYYVRAKDPSGNQSAASQPVSATTLSGGGGGGTSTLQPTDDAYVYEGSNADTNYGTNDNLYLKTDSGKNRIAYLKFSLPGIGSVSSAKLRVYGSASSNTTLSAYETADNWNEGTLTWNNKPAVGSVISGVPIGTADAYHEIDVTAYVRAQAAGDAVASFVLQESVGKYTTLNSSENASNRPELVITP